MKNKIGDPVVADWEKVKNELDSSELVIIAAGFEQRSLTFFNKVWGEGIRNLLLIKYEAGPKENNTAFAKINATIKRTARFHQKVNCVALDTNKPLRFEQDLQQAILQQKLPNYGSIWVDLSGISTYAICIILRICRAHFPMMDLNLIYTEAEAYYPTEKEYRKYYSKYGEKGIERLPISLTSEMSENLILDSFSGFTIRKDPTCLLLYAGYERHRSIGAIENINPSKLVIIYGKPGRRDLEWRLDMSKHLHANLLNERIRSEEVTSTLSVSENYQLLYEYYEMLYGDHNICISPINSKMQTVATYLIWETFKDIQLVFPLPIRYLPKRFSEAAGKTFHMRLTCPEGIDTFTTSFPFKICRV